MNEAEIMKALECCCNGVILCKSCPYKKYNLCSKELLKDVLDLLNRKNAEIENARSEAIKEFAERVKEAGAKSVEVAFYGNGTETIEFITLRTSLVDQIAKEMGVETDV